MAHTVHSGIAACWALCWAVEARWRWCCCWSPSSEKDGPNQSATEASRSGLGPRNEEEQQGCPQRGHCVNCIGMRWGSLLRTAGKGIWPEGRAPAEVWGGREREAQARGRERAGLWWAGTQGVCGGNGHRIRCSAAAFESMVLMHTGAGKRLVALDCESSVERWWGPGDQWQWAWRDRREAQGCQEGNGECTWQLGVRVRQASGCSQDGSAWLLGEWRCRTGGQQGRACVDGKKWIACGPSTQRIWVCSGVWR